MKKTLLSAAFALTAVMSTPLHAAETLPRLSPAKMAAMLTAAGATKVVIATPSNGVEFITFDDGNGPALFALGDCTPEGCEILQMMIFYDTETAKTYSLATLNAYNADNLNAQAALMPSGELALMRMLVTTGGVTEENIMAHVAIFLQAPGHFAKTLADQKIAAADVPATVTPVVGVPAAGVQAGIAMRNPRLKKLNLFEIVSKRAAGLTRKLP